MTWVKVCGTTSLEDAELSVAAGANALGFIFAPSARRVDVARAAEIVSGLAAEVEKVGVFVNETSTHVAEVVRRVGLTGVQLHGDEPAGSMAEFRQALGDRRIVKVLQVGELIKAGNELAQYLAAWGAIDAILLDSGSPAQRGGTGMAFDWSEAAPLAAEIQATTRVIIAGGLTSHNVGDAVRIMNPWGIDVVSGVEREPGKKDETRLRDFFAASRRAAQISVR